MEGREGTDSEFLACKEDCGLLLGSDQLGCTFSATMWTEYILSTGLQGRAPPPPDGAGTLNGDSL